MTCVWNGLLQGLKLPQNNLELFVDTIKKYNKITTNILHNGLKLPDKLLLENKISIDNLEIKSIYNGYLCSTCDPLLFLVCDLYNVSIIHNYNGTKIEYKNINFPNKILNFSSDSGHFWFNY